MSKVCKTIVILQTFRFMNSQQFHNIVIISTELMDLWIFNQIHLANEKSLQILVKTGRHQEILWNFSKISILLHTWIPSLPPSWYFIAISDLSGCVHYVGIELCWCQQMICTIFLQTGFSTKMSVLWGAELSASCIQMTHFLYLCSARTFVISGVQGHWKLYYKVP